MSQPIAFSFGDPEAVLNKNVTDYLGVTLSSNEQYYTPPVSLKGLAKLRHANAHHLTALQFKRNVIVKWFRDSYVLRKSDFKKAVYEHLVFGQSYYKVIRNGFGRIQRLVPLPGIPMRRLKEQGRYCMLQPNGLDPVIFKKDEIIHLKEYDPQQEIYGEPEYLAAMQSVLLNEGATLFRRKYYENGAHMGYILYTADAKFDPNDEKKLIEKIKGSKGIGNFRSMFMNIPGGKPDSLKIIPVGDVATKDEFERIKNISRNDVISMHRIPPALAGVMPENNGGFGDIEKISKVHYENEVIPMQDNFLELNEYLPSNRRVGFIQPTQN